MSKLTILGTEYDLENASEIEALSERIKTMFQKDAQHTALNLLMAICDLNIQRLQLQNEVSGWKSLIETGANQ